MCIKTQTSRFTGSSWAQLERLAAALQKATLGMPRSWEASRQAR